MKNLRKIFHIHDYFVFRFKIFVDMDGKLLTEADVKFTTKLIYT